ncbi:DAK2 domain-containing protein [Cellulomonas sp. Sa3CUA2]|uniref:DAK2 domain-containing protein n=1 Tax=Cellulomonas avistercoris TaxID=2762242 RepID=A0ABR8QCE6_9CELL|nr:DAK2 domain-containing protein [Cellulomonas avistercoris]MBD7918061.1 DAK2 domain-containing protein [Cellulomonas avistercoris]
MRVEVAARQVVLDGDAVRAWARGALTACRAARERIDAVNVFPVPDADTGSNVTLTVAGGAEAVAADRGDDGAMALLTAFARGAARSARGNSGIILSQWLVGLAAGLAQDEPPGAGGAAALVTGLERAAEAARGAVPDPQEGTVLTVAREVAAHARRGLGGAAGSPADVLAAATDAARADLARLSAGHDVLRAARVVDAGACALLVVLDALVHTLRTGGGALGEADLDLDWLPRATPDVVAGCGPAVGGAYEVMMLVRPTWPGADDLAGALQEVGDAVAVVDAGGSRHAHVHCDDPAAAIALVPHAAREQVVVRRVDEPAPAARGLVVLTASPGLSAWYATCGAVTLVGDDPGAEQVARAAVDTRAGRAVVVAAGVGATGGAPAGAPAGAPFDLLTTPGDGPAVVACLALVADAQLSPDAGRDALARLRSATPAGRGAVGHALAALLPQVPAAQGVTLVHGHGVDPAAARAAADGLAAAHPQLEVVVAGPAAGADWWVGVD